MPYILSPEQKVVYDSLIHKKASSTKYFDIVVAMQAVCESSASLLAEGRKILIHIPDDEVKDVFKNMLETNGLSDVSIDVADTGHLPEVDVIKMRSTLKKEKNSDAMINFVLAKRKKEDINTEALRYYSALDKRVMSDVVYRHYALNSIYTNRSSTSKLMVDLSSDQGLQMNLAEYYGLKKEIENASKIYNRQHDLYDHLALFSDAIWTNLNSKSIADIQLQLAVFAEESTKLVQSYNSGIKNLRQASTRELDQKFVNLYSRFTHHEEACIAYHIKSQNAVDSKEGMFGIFKKKNDKIANKIYVEAFDELSGLIQSVSDQWYDELESPTTEMITYDFITKFISDQKAKARLHNQTLRNHLHKSLQRVNRINTNSSEVKSLDQSLSDLIKKMNDSRLFDLDLEHNILSFLKQFELLKEITDYIEKCNILANSSSDFFEWKSFYNSSSSTFRHIFTELKKLPKKSWVEEFAQWYEVQIHQHTLDSNTISSKLLTRLHSETKDTHHYQISALEAELHDSRIESAQNLKATSKELHNTLFKKKQMPETSWSRIGHENHAFMQAFFPLHISDRLARPEAYDVVVSFSKIDDPSSGEIHHFSPIESKDIQNLSEAKHNFLYLNDYNYKGTLASLSSTDKLKASKKLAKFILSLNQNIKIYQLKNANIISLLPPQDDAHLEGKLDNLNVKVIDTAGVLYDRLTESILLTERRPFLIIKDELINSELYEHILWQLELLELFRRVGYEVLSTNTCDQVVDNDEVFDRIIKKVIGQEAVSQVPDVPPPTSKLDTQPKITQQV